MNRFFGILFRSNHLHSVISSGSVTLGSPKYFFASIPIVIKCACSFWSLFMHIMRISFRCIPVSSNSSRIAVSSKVSPYSIFPPGIVQVPSPCSSESAVSGFSLLFPSSILPARNTIMPTPAPMCCSSFSIVVHIYCFGCH